MQIRYYDFPSGTHIEVNRPLAEEEEQSMTDYQGIRTLYNYYYVYWCIIRPIHFNSLFPVFDEDPLICN